MSYGQNTSDYHLALTYLQRWDMQRPVRINEAGHAEPAPYPTHDEAHWLAMQASVNTHPRLYEPKGKK